MNARARHQLAAIVFISTSALALALAASTPVINGKTIAALAILALGGTATRHVLHPRTLRSASESSQSHHPASVQDAA
jgi:hypothetical protein